MTVRWLAWRGASFHRRHHAAVMLGIVVSSTVMTGALVVGDSVRASLRALVLARLGRTELAVTTGEHRVRPEVATALESSLGVQIAPVLRLVGHAANSDGRLSASRVQVLGIDDRFWSLDASERTVDHRADAVLVNRRLATLLGLRPDRDDEIVLRIPEVHAISGELPIAWKRAASRPTRLQVHAVVDDDHLGRFSLEASQRSPATLLMPRGRLGALLGTGDRANLLLVSTRTGDLPAADDILRSLRAALSLKDLDLELQSTDREGYQLVSRHFFLPPAAARTALEACPTGQGVLSYFVNSIESSGGTTPYSFVAAVGAPWVPTFVGEDEIVLTDWAARDLGASVGAAVELRYFAPSVGTRLDERASRFRVAAIVPMTATDRRLVPDLPGLTEAETCLSWDPSFPLDLERVRPADEAYWKAHGAAPKAFITLAAGQRLWGSRHGSLTTIRFARDDGPPCAITRAILARIDPAALGMRASAVREEGLRAAAGSVDFGGLFLGLSAFLVAAALLFVALFQTLAISRRSGEWRALALLGLSPRQVRRIVLFEGAPVALLASIAGAVLAGPYAAILIRLVPSVWGGAAATASLVVSVRPWTLALGVAQSTLLAVAVMVVVARLHTVPRLVDPVSLPAAATPIRRRIMTRVSLALVGLGVALAVGLALDASGGASAVAVWLVGALALGAGLLGASALFDALSMRPFGSLAYLGLRNVARQRRRSLTLVTGLATAGFLVTVVALHRGSTGGDDSARASGTGGFTFMAETALPVRQDLNDPEGRRALGLSERLPARFVALRVGVGDDASCRNLNRVALPRVLGVDPTQLAQRGAFSFVASIDGAGGAGSWRVLDDEPGDGSVPAVADANTIMWALGKKLGDVIQTTDEEGRPLRLRLVASLDGTILQGNVMVSERQFTRHFPSVMGYGALLIDTQPGASDRVAADLRTALRDHGLDLEHTSARLAELRSVEDTYLAIFLALGGLGLTLASAGCAAIVARDVIARGRELAFLRATGFSGGAVARMVVGEHALLVTMGVALGVLAGVIACVPGLAHLPSGSAVLTIALTVGLVSTTGVVAAMLACRPMLRRELIGNLRCE